MMVCSAASADRYDNKCQVNQARAYSTANSIVALTTHTQLGLLHILLSLLHRLCCPLSKSAGSVGHWMWRKLQWQLLQQLLLRHPSMTLPRVSGTLPSVHSVLLLLRIRQQLLMVLEATRRGSINGMGQLLTGRDQSTGRLQR